MSLSTLTEWVEQYEPTVALTASAWIDLYAPITADSAGWRKWCEENPEKCGGGPKLDKDPWANARALRVQADKIDEIRDPIAHAEAIVALGREAQQRGDLPNVEKVREEWQALRATSSAADEAAARRMIELRLTPGQSVQDIPLVKDFNEQVLAHDAEYQRLSTEADDAYRQSEDLRDSMLSYPDDLAAGLQKLGVSMGPTAQTPGPWIADTANLGRSMEKALEHTPTRWLDRIGQTEIVVDLDPNGRAYYASADDQIHVGLAASSSTLRHEMVHALEAHDRGEVSQAQQNFLSKRSGVDFGGLDPWADKLQPLNDMQPSSGYRSDEVAVKAGFTNAYSGKYYGTGHWEVLSTGVQQMFSASGFSSGIEGDPEFEQWVLGMIVKTGL